MPSSAVATVLRSAPAALFLIVLTLPLAVAGPASSASGAVTGFNPYEASNGFTVVGRGDVTLNNGELEGSGAAFGTIAAGRENYPIVHMAAGQADYAAPTVDGRSVRILAGAGSGADPAWLAAGLGVDVTGLVALIGSRLAGHRR